MNENGNHITSQRNSPRSFWLPVLGAGLLVACGAVVYEGMQMQDLRHRFDTSQQFNAALQAKLSDADSDMRKTIGSIQDQLAQDRADAGASVARAQTAASSHADAVARQIAKQQEQQTRNLAAQLGEVKQSTQEASTKLDGRIDGVSTEVGAVKTDVETAKSAIEDTKSELQRSRGDMGMMSGLIATNSQQIQTLRDMGDRNIYEFTVTKSGHMQKVGDIQVMLRKADPKGSRYTIDLVADDKRVEKKDRTMNEPVQFYTASARQPYELVVNQVQKDKIVGYLATPKVTVSRNEPKLQ
jgi:hypothetical protein